MLTGFLLEGERAYAGASQLFTRLERLGIPTAPYELPVPYILSPDELQYYVASLRNELRGKQPSEDLAAVKRICDSLNKWACDGLICHVI